MDKTARTKVGRRESEGCLGSEFWILGVMLTRHSLFYKLLDSSKCFKQWHYTIQLMFRK